MPVLVSPAGGDDAVVLRRSGVVLYCSGSGAERERNLDGLERESSCERVDSGWLLLEAWRGQFSTPVSVSATRSDVASHTAGPCGQHERRQQAAHRLPVEDKDYHALIDGSLEELSSV